MKTKKLPITCPACENRLGVEKLRCKQCDTVVEGSFGIPVLLQLSREEQEFILMFLKASGSLKEMAKHLGYSYPKVRNMLDEIIEKLRETEAALTKDENE